MTPSESIIVKSAWYGKQTASASHEFILIQVEDGSSGTNHNENLINYLILDRNVLSQPHKPSKIPKLGKSKKLLAQSQLSNQGGLAVDTFKISYDGDVERLLADCELHPYRLIEQLRFSSDKPLLFYELVTLAHLVSERYPKYDALDLSGYFFAGLIWETLRQLRPDAIHINDKSLVRERGKHGWYRYTTAEAQVKDIYAQAEGRIREAKGAIEEKKSVFEDLIQQRLAEARGTRSFFS